MSSGDEAERVTLDIGDLPVTIHNISIEGHKHTSSKFLFSELKPVVTARTFGEMNEKIFEASEVSGLRSNIRNRSC